MRLTAAAIAVIAAAAGGRNDEALHRFLTE